ncbi:alpha/beta hydrolase [Dermatobacter hominis]|uniref:alpha/beta hydrolase n=1 Tax=Dermatobacter hominis TaxID=2884263 RepID=UPI001D0F69F0|nr:alpha/beta hydrolase [Dermatobacter hominis]UDY34168.1 alpha/beta hydrolase [Dermatobacter hominis]
MTVGDDLRTSDRRTSGGRPSDRSVHPDLRRAARLVPRPPRAEGLAAVRRVEVGIDRVDRAVRRVVPVDRDVEVVDGATVDGGAWSVRVHRPPEPADGPRAALLSIHGGGYVMGRAVQDDALCRVLARGLGMVVASVDYRLAPAHPFPAPLEDCYGALAWLMSQPEVDADRVAIGGMSAGGGLAAGLAILARDRGELRPALQLLSYPMLDDRTVLRDDIDESGFRLWGNRTNRYGWRSYLGAEPGAEGLTAPAVPARCEDLSGLPPAWIGVGTLDLFLDEDVAYAERLRAAGVPCELEVVDGAFHGFDRIAARVPVSRDFCVAQARALTRALRPTAAPPRAAT